MSHVVAYPGLVVTDLKVLAEVAEELGLELVQAQTYKWFGSWVKDYHKDDAAYKLGIDPEKYGHCDGYKLKIKGDNSAYEIGLHKDPAGSEGYVLVYDFYGHQGQALRNKIGMKGEKIKQGYTLALAKKQMQKKGFRVTGQKTLENGKVQLKMQRGV